MYTELLSALLCMCVFCKHISTITIVLVELMYWCQLKAVIMIYLLQLLYVVHELHNYIRTYVLYTLL